MKTNIRLVLLGEVILFAAVFVLGVYTAFGATSLAWFLDLPSLLLILVILIPGLLILGVWKDFLKAFSVGIREFGLLELKNIIEAVGAAQMLTVFGALFAFFTSGVIVLGHYGDTTMVGPGLAVCILSAYYASIIEFLLFPLKLNARRELNKKMDH